MRGDFTEEELKESFELFSAASMACRGNISKIAERLKVSVSTIYGWEKKYPEVKEALAMGRRQLFYDCFSTSTVVAMGIPQKDEEGRLVGWIERPDSQMLRFFMTKLGKEEGFAENVNVDVTTKGDKLSTGIQVEIIDSRDKVASYEDEEDESVSEEE